MGRHYCDYCDIYLTHDSLNVRKAHNSGRNHQANVVNYFMNLGGDHAQDIINRIQRQYEGGPPPGAFGGGVMRAAGPPQGFMPPPMGMGMPPPGQFPPPGGFNGAPPPFMPPPNFQPQMGMGMGMPPPQGQMGMPPPAFPPNGLNAGMQNQPPPPGPTFTSAPPGGMAGGAPPAASGTGRPMVNPERMRMMGM